MTDWSNLGSWSSPRNLPWTSALLQDARPCHAMPCGTDTLNTRARRVEGRLNVIPPGGWRVRQLEPLVLGRNAGYLCGKSMAARFPSTCLIEMGSVPSEMRSEDHLPHWQSGTNA